MRYIFDECSTKGLTAVPESDQKGISRDEVMRLLGEQSFIFETKLREYEKKADTSEIKIAELEDKLTKHDKKIKERDREIAELTAKNAKQAKIIKDLQAKLESGQQVLTENELYARMSSKVKNDKTLSASERKGMLIELDLLKAGIAGAVGGVAGLAAYGAASVMGCTLVAGGSLAVLSTFCLAGVLFGVVAYAGYRYYVQLKDGNKKAM